MSTKCTITHGDGYHLYWECLDDDNVYIEIENPIETEVRQWDGKVFTSLSIPLKIWNKMVEKGKLLSWSGEDPENPRTQEERNKEFEDGMNSTLEWLSKIKKEKEKEGE